MFRRLIIYATILLQTVCCSVYQSPGRKYLEGPGTAGLLRINKACHQSIKPSSIDLQNPNDWVLLEHNVESNLDFYRSESTEPQLIVIPAAEQPTLWCGFTYSSAGNYVDLVEGDSEGAKTWLLQRLTD